MSPPDKSGGVSRRAVAVGLVGTALLGIATPYADLFLNSTWIAACHLPIGAFTLFVVVLVLSRLALGLLARPLGLSGREVLVSYCLMLAGAGIPSFGLTGYLVPTLAGAFYFDSPENNWQGLFFRYIPQWLVPVDLRSYPPVAAQVQGNWVYAVYDHLPAWLQPAPPAIMQTFYQGLPEGRHLTALELLRGVPWGAWLLPLAAWTVIAYTLFWLVVCLSVVVRRQWVERERLTYPLVQLPIEMIGREQQGLSAFFRSRLMWLGFAAPMVVHGLNGWHVYNPGIPSFPLAYDLAQYFVTWPWNQIGWLSVYVHFSVIGFSFLLPTELSLSLWLFYFVFKLEGVGIAALGYNQGSVPGYATPGFAAWQMLGAFFALAVGMAWAARGHLARVWQLARRPQPDEGEAQEPMSYRAAVFGLAGCLLLLTAFSAAAGLQPLLALVVFALFIITILVLARFVAEGGLLFIQAPFRPSDILALALGTAPLGAANLTVLAYMERTLSFFDVRGFLLPFLNDIWKLSGLADLPKRRLLPKLLWAIAVATVVSYATVLLLAYRHGAVTMSPWFAIYSPQQPFQFLKSYIEAPPRPNYGAVEITALGALVMWGLLILRARLPWWPLHPIGYAMGPSWPMIQLWSSILVGWALKATLLRFGGMKTYRAARPAFLGLVLGEFTAAALWMVIDALMGVQGHRMFLF